MLRFKNITPGQIINLTGIDALGDFHMESLKRTFSVNTPVGSIELCSINAAGINPDLPNSFIKGMKMVYTGLERSQSIITVGFRVIRMAVEKHDSKVYVSNSPWVFANLVNIEDAGADNVRHSVSNTGFNQLALAGSLFNASLICSGATRI